MKRLLIHFDVPEDYVLLETFIQSALSAQSAVNAINRNCFEDKIKIELIVFPPESGTLKQYIGIVFKGSGVSYAVLWSIVQLLDSQAVQEISQELIGQTPTDAIIDQIRDWKSRAHEPEPNASDRADPDIESQAREIVERFLTESTRSALEMSRDKIDNSSIPDDLRHDLAQAQSLLYRGALEDSSVASIGFTEEEDFPIPRSEFARRAVPPALREDEPEDAEWIVSIESINITSPNFDREDQERRRWKGRVSNGAPILFEIHDEDFWTKLRSREIEFADRTVLLVQMATRLIDSRPEEKRVLRVLKVNNSRFGELLDENALQSILGRFLEEGKSNRDDDLFGDL